MKKAVVAAIGLVMLFAGTACTPWQASAVWASGYGPTKVRICESGNNYAINTGNGYFGAWQFDIPSWHANGGGNFSYYPHHASKAQQDYVAWTYWKKAGWRPWACKP